MKKILFVQRGDTPHWVGNGFPVRSMFHYRDQAREMSPFLLMDYAGPTEFDKSYFRRGVGEHPHRGFETVTLVYQGEVEHRDSSGGGGVISAGDVQWMTAASGLVHEEMHSEKFSKEGGAFETIQLWVNLPAKDKMSKPGYQSLRAKDIPVVKLPGGEMRLIAGDYAGQKAAAKTFTPIELWDFKVKPGIYEFKVPAGHSASVFVRKGKILIGETGEVSATELAVLDRDEDLVRIEVLEEAEFLFMGGEVINEPVIGYGPFVMNTPLEIAEAMRDYEEGKMGHIA